MKESVCLCDFVHPRSTRWWNLHRIPRQECEMHRKEREV